MFEGVTRTKGNHLLIDLRATITCHHLNHGQVINLTLSDKLQINKL